MNMQLKQFDDEHGSVVTNALAVYAQRMRETAAEAQAAYLEAELGGPAPEPARVGSTISLTPTAGGWHGMARLFGEAADKADAALNAYEHMTGQDDDDEN